MRYAVLLNFCLLFHLAQAQTGKVFPGIETEKISGKTVDMPSAFHEGYSLVGVGMGKRAEEALRTWQAPVYNKFIAKTGLMDDMYDVEVYFLPVFTGASRAAKGKIVKKLKQNNEALVIDNVYIYSGKKEPFDAVGIDDKSEPYFMLVNGEGKIVYTAKGAFKQKYLDEITEILIEQ